MAVNIVKESQINFEYVVASIGPYNWNFDLDIGLVPYTEAGIVHKAFAVEEFNLDMVVAIQIEPEDKLGIEAATGTSTRVLLQEFDSFLMVVTAI